MHSLLGLTLQIRNTCVEKQWNLPLADNTYVIEKMT